MVQTEGREPIKLEPLPWKPKPSQAELSLKTDTDIVQCDAKVARKWSNVEDDDYSAFCIIIIRPARRQPKQSNDKEASMPTECLTCKPGDATHHQSAVVNTGCESSYALVDECMKRHNGSVSACKDQWELFRKCHEQGKNAKAQADRSPSRV